MSRLVIARSSDVVGNRANQQFQLDVFGESLLLLARAAELDQLDADGARAMDTAAAAIAERWRQPDAGIWELDNHFWTHSRLTCVHGLRAAARTRPGRQAGAWLELADAVRAETSRRCTAPSGRWQRGRQRRAARRRAAAAPGAGHGRVHRPA